MKALLAIAIISLFAWNVQAQTAKDLLRNGQQNKSGEFYFNGNLECYFKGTSPEQFFELGDSAIVEVPNGYVVYLKAYNPLHVGHTFESKLVLDPINQVAIDFFNDFASQLTSLDSILAKQMRASNNKDFSLSKIKHQAEQQVLIRELKRVDSVIMKIVEDKQGLKLSQQLIDLEFKDAAQTKVDAKGIRIKRDSLKAQLSDLFDELDSLREVAMKSRKKQEWIQQDWLVDDALYRISLELLEVIRKHQQIEGNLEKLLIRVEDPLKKWAEFERSATVISNNEWFIGIRKEGSLDKKSIEVITLKKVLHPVKIVGDQLVVASDSIAKTVTIRLIKRQLIVFEASAGFAFSPQDKSDFVTAKNDAGDLVVSNADSKQLEQINVTSMLNLNFNVWKDETVLPFLQLGVGLNSDIPLALFGGGLRFDFGENRIFALSTGVSFTGIKALTDLELGGEVKDDLTLQNDLRYQISAPKMYFGIQFNF